MRKITILAAVLTLSLAALGQTVDPNALPNNIYAFGPTFNPNASPFVSGTMMYGRLMDGAKGTYAVGVVDAVPTTTAPVTVTTTASAGVAQLFLNNGKLKLFATTSAGLSYTSTNAGYGYALGGMATYDINAKYAIGFGGRLYKSNISNSGDQPTLSVEFILKQ